MEAKKKEKKKTERESLKKKNNRPIGIQPHGIQTELTEKGKTKHQKWVTECCCSVRQSVQRTE